MAPSPMAQQMAQQQISQQGGRHVPGTGMRPARPGVPGQQGMYGGVPPQPQQPQPQPPRGPSAGPPTAGAVPSKPRARKALTITVRSLKLPC